MNLQGFAWRSIKTKVVFATLGIFVLCIWTLTFYASRFLREDMEKLLGEQQFSRRIAASATGQSRLNR